MFISIFKYDLLLPPGMRVVKKGTVKEKSLFGKKIYSDVNIALHNPSF